MCLFPKTGYISIVDGKRKVYFNYPNPSQHQVVSKIDLPCGKCVECCQAYSNTWAFRCMLEASLYKDNCFITLTYKDAPRSVSKRELQLFLKLLRKEIYPLKIRYFSCGEYGYKGGRPHYHLCIFGWKPSDMVYFFTRDGHNVFKSEFVYDVWCRSNSAFKGHGFISVEDIDYGCARYCAKYLQKLNDYPADVEPPFVLMSLKPSIGWDAFNIPVALKTGKIYFNGREYFIPKSFMDKLVREGVILDEVKDNRLLSASLHKRSYATLSLNRSKAFKKFGRLTRL